MDTEELFDKLVEESERDEDTLREEVEDKMEEFSGLVSEEGAIHLVAKEEGIELAETSQEDIKVDNVVPEMRNLDIKARVVNISDKNTFERDDGEDGEVQNLVLGDDTGTIRVTLWDDQTKIAEQVDEGDAIEIEGAYTVEDNRENAEIRLGDNSKVTMAEEDEVPEVSSQGGGEYEKARIRDVQTENTNYEIQGMLLDVYTNNPFYQRCPKCGNTLQGDEGQKECPEHGEVDPEYALAVSGVLDDGTENMRVVFFREQARDILGVSEEEEKEGDQQAVEKGAEEAVGQELVVRGNTRYNDYFGRIEMIANEVDEMNVENKIEEKLAKLEI